jgi:endothelin-converting enzyme/putative endopeptidase
MNRRLAIPPMTLALLGLAGAAFAAEAPAPAAVERPLTAIPYTPSLDPTVMDRAVDPCVDFYKFSCGKWLEKNPIPPDQSSWDVYAKAAEDNRRFLWGMLEEAARPDPKRDANTRKIGDYFASCMDEAAIDKAGVDPLKPRLAAIAALESKADLAGLLGQLHLEGGARSMLFSFGADQNPEASSQVIGIARAGGLGLSDRDDYLREDPHSKEVREHYRAYVRRIFELLGRPQPEREAEAVLRLETALAKASLTRVERRDPHKTVHLMKRQGLQALTPDFHWDAYLSALGQPGLDEFNVTEPAFFQAVETELSSIPLDDLRAYLRFHLANRAAPNLSAPFVQANYEFFSAYLRGAKAIAPRWKRCVADVNRDLGEMLGEVFVRKVFPPAVKGDAEKMVTEIRAAMAKRIETSPWMSAETRQQALVKLRGMRDKIGYPDHWRDYSALEVSRGDFAGNTARAAVFQTRRDLAKIGKPVDRGEWRMTPPTVNAYYNPLMNDINFPAGVLLPPLYDPKIDAAPNYGNTGATIGHELTHGFDDEGRQYDAEGNLRNWWTPGDDKEFRQRVSCVADQYAQYTVVDDLKINSQLTLGEDVADLGGLIIAYLAWQDDTRGQTLAAQDGLTPPQRFFVGFAQWACGGDRPEARRLSARTNPHSPAEARINGVLVNVPEFAQAFACKAGQPMIKEPEKVCRIW